MDRDRFDALARLLGSTGSRRAALGALLGTGLAGTAADAAAKRGRRRRRVNRRGGHVRAQQVPANCFTNPTCTPGPAKNLSKCDYADSATLAGKNLKGSNLTNANLAQADATGADLRAVNLGKSCLTNADLSDAKINASTNFSTAIFCGTIMPDGSINDRDCGQPTRCCEVCTSLGDECNDDTAPCCEGGVCQEGTCVSACLKDSDCPFGSICCGDTCQFAVCCALGSGCGLLLDRCCDPGCCRDGVCGTTGCDV
jgi:hypothetical protein